MQSACLVSSPPFAVTKPLLPGFSRRRSTVLATDFRYTEQAGLQAPGYEILRITGNLDWFKGLIADSGAKRIGFEGTDVNVTMHAALVKALKDLETKHKLLPTVNLIDQIRAVKEPEELEVLEHAIWIADTAMEQVSDRIQPGMTEKQVAWQMELAMRELGADSISFDTIVAAGTNGARPHHRHQGRAGAQGALEVRQHGRQDGAALEVEPSCALRCGPSP